MQSLAQCENALSNLKVIQENADDSASAAQVIIVYTLNLVVHWFCYALTMSCIYFHLFFSFWVQFVSSSGLRDVGAIASAQAASIYGLNILEEKIQVMDLLVR